MLSGYRTPTNETRIPCPGVARLLMTWQRHRYPLPNVGFLTDRQIYLHLEFKVAPPLIVNGGHSTVEMAARTPPWLNTTPSPRFTDTIWTSLPPRPASFANHRPLTHRRLLSQSSQ